MKIILLSWELWQRVVSESVTNVSEESTASIFRVKYGDSTFLRNLCNYLSENPRYVN
jgi:hypothetical protein